MSSGAMEDSVPVAVDGEDPNVAMSVSSQQQLNEERRERDGATALESSTTTTTIDCGLNGIVLLLSISSVVRVEGTT